MGGWLFAWVCRTNETFTLCRYEYGVLATDVGVGVGMSISVSVGYWYLVPGGLMCWCLRQVQDVERRVKNAECKEESGVYRGPCVRYKPDKYHGRKSGSGDCVVW